ncbi:MAG: flagellar basal body P-ring protein FlgI [Bryobacteraceae bacterium]
MATEVSAGSNAVRLKDLATIEGVRDNQLIGYGMVVGLAGTGDRRQTVFSSQTLTNILQRMGVTVLPTAIQVRNTAAVMVTAMLPPFAQPGSKVDVTVAAIGDAPNLQGGLLLMTPLRAASGETYAVAQGSVVTGGFAAGRSGNSQTVNHPTAGRIADGAIVERGAPSVIPTHELHLQLRRPDFITASRVAASINKTLGNDGPLLAQANNSSVIVVHLPSSYDGRSVDFIAAVEAIQVEVDRPARIAIDEKTGTIVFGGDVRIAPVSILHGNLTVEVQTAFDVSQPAPFSGPGAATAVVPQTSVGAKADKATNIVLGKSSKVEDLVTSLTAIGSTPRDIIAILQNLKAAGAIDAEIDVM